MCAWLTLLCPGPLKRSDQTGFGLTQEQCTCSVIANHSIELFQSNIKSKLINCHVGCVAGRGRTQCRTQIKKEWTKEGTHNLVTRNYKVEGEKKNIYNFEFTSQPWYTRTHAANGDDATIRRGRLRITSGWETGGNTLRTNQLANVQVEVQLLHLKILQ